MTPDQMKALAKFMRNAIPDAGHEAFDRMTTELEANPSAAAGSAVVSVLAGETWDATKTPYNKGDVFLGIYAGVAMAYGMVHSESFRKKVAEVDLIHASISRVIDALAGIAKAADTPAPEAGKPTSTVEYKFVAQGPSTVQ